MAVPSVAPVGQVVEASRSRVADEGVARILALGDGGDAQAGRAARPARPSSNGRRRRCGRRSRASSISLVNRRLAADLQQTAVLDAVAGGGDDRPAGATARRRRGRRRPGAAAMRALHHARLGQGQLGAAGADADGQVMRATRAAGRYLGRRRRTGADYSSDRQPATEMTAAASPSSASRPAATRPPPRSCAWHADGARDGAVLASSHSQIDDHAAYGGVVPEIAARSHVEMIDGVVRRAMAEAGLGYDGAGRRRRHRRAGPGRRRDGRAVASARRWPWPAACR